MAASSHKPKGSTGKAAGRAVPGTSTGDTSQAGVAAGVGWDPSQTQTSDASGSGGDQNAALMAYLQSLSQPSQADQFGAAVAYGNARADAQGQVGLDQLGQQLAGNQLNRSNQSFDIQAQGIAASQGESQRQAGLQTQSQMSSAVARGATTSPGNKQSLQSIQDSLAYTQGGYGRQLQNIGLGREAAQDTYTSSYASLTQAINSLLRNYPGI